MARRTIGSVNKPTPGMLEKNPKAGRYIKISEDVVLKKGQYVNLESVADQIEGLQRAMEAGKLSEDYVQKQIERLEKTPDFVAFHLVTQVDSQ